MKILQITIIALILLGCKTTKEKLELVKGNVTIEGQIQNNTQNVQFVNLTYAILDQQRKSESIDSLNHFKLSFEVLSPQVVTLKLNRSRIKIYVEPNNNIHITINENPENNSFFLKKIEGDNAEVSKNINDFENFYNIYDFYPDIDSATSVSDFYKQLESNLRLTDSIQQIFIDSVKPSPKFVNWLKFETQYYFASYISMFLYIHKEAGTYYTGEAYNKSLFPVDNDSAMVTGFYYPFHLMEYVYETYLQRDSTISRLFESNNLGEAYSMALSQINAREVAGLSRDIMNYQLISSLIYKDYSYVKPLWEKNKSYITDKTVISLLDSISQMGIPGKQISELDSILKSDKIFDYNYFQEIQKRNENKIIYLDIWGTWCHPCIVQIPLIKQFEELYFNQPISFVKICASSDSLQWVECLKKYDISGENYYLNNNQSDYFRSLLNLEGFPSYFIIDKNGKLSRAPNPYSKENLKKRFEQELL